MFNRIQIIRLEDDDGIGVYRSIFDNDVSAWNNVTNAEPFDEMQNDEIHVHPYDDKELNIRFNLHTDLEFIFAFLNKKQYKKWFYNPEWRELIGNYGIKLSIYEINENLIRKSKHQVAFKRKDSILIKQVDPFHFK